MMANSWKRILGTVLAIILFGSADTILLLGANPEAGQTDSSPTNSAEYTYYAKPLLDKEYYHAVLNAIKRSKKSIKIAMLLINMIDQNDPTTKLVQALIEAQKRGVSVEVVLDCPPRDVERGTESKLYRNNERTIKLLRENGCKANFDTPNRTLHAKIILIDDDLVIIGNHNWSRAALWVNDEASVMIKCSPDNGPFLNFFKSIKLMKKGESKEERLEDIMKLHEELLKQ